MGLGVFTGATLTGDGTLANNGLISVLGHSTIQGLTVSQTPAGLIQTGPASSVTLDSAKVVGGTLTGQFEAKNGASVNGVTFSAFGLTDGSALGVTGSSVNNDAFKLGSATGATLSGTGPLVNNGSLSGVGTVQVPIVNNGGIVAQIL